MNTVLLTLFVLIGVAAASDFRVTLGISQVSGQVGIGFDPNRIVPSPGDTITFTWLIPSYIQNPPTGSYSATQSTFENPCTPMAGGFDSGPQTTGPESAGQAPTMTFTVKDNQPLYFFSKVGDQCKQGMVLGVNSPAVGPGSVESYITAAGGDPHATHETNDTSPSNTTTTTPTTTTNSTISKNQTSIASPNSTKSTTSSSTNSTSAKPQNNAAVINAPGSAIAVFAIFAASFFL